MPLQQTIRRFGVPAGAPGIEVIEKSGANALADPRYGTSFMLGTLKRGPMGVAIPVTNKRQYDLLFGDSRDSTWHLFNDGSHLLPDAIDGYYTTGGGAGMLWITRLLLDGKATKSELVLKNRVGADALKVMAANEGRWGGYANSVPLSPVVAATMVTFTIVAPGILIDQYKDGIAELSGSPGKTYTIVSNTAADPKNNEVVFVIGAQYDLLADGVSGPTTLSGLANYSSKTPVTGTVAFPEFLNLTGTATLNDRVITGLGTAFSTELKVGQTIFRNGEGRVVQSITSNTTLTIGAPFTLEGSGLTLQKDNLVVTGTGTLFQAELAPGMNLYATVNSSLQGRKIVSIESDSSLTLASGWTSPQTAGSTIVRDNLTVTGVGTKFALELAVGSFIIDPNRASAPLKVTAIASATSLTVESPFQRDFSNSQITKQAQLATVALTQEVGKGLAVKIGQGLRYPQTHFSMTVTFNSSPVLSIDDASLDPHDQYFIEPLVNDSNVAYRTSGASYQTWITVESLWTSAYTTNKEYDVRPANGSGMVVALDKNKLYFANLDLDLSTSIGSLLYPDPYALPRGYVRVKDVKNAVSLSGTISSIGASVTGTQSAFTSELALGDYIYEPGSKSSRKVVRITSDTDLLLESSFPRDIVSPIAVTKAGWMQCEQGYDLRTLSDIGSHFITVFPSSLTKGYDGDVANIVPYFFTQFADADTNHIENATFGKNLGLIRIACPGISDQTVQKSFINYASQKAYEFRAEIPSSYNTAATAEFFVQQVLGRNDFQAIAFPSYGFVANPNGYGTRMISLSGDIMGGESLKSTSNLGYHIPFAGINAVLPRIIKLPFEAYPNDEAIINTAGLQCIKTMYGNIVVYGARVPSLSPTYDFLHVRRIQSNFVRLFMEARSLLELIFQPNQAQLNEQILMTMNNFGRSEYKKGVFTNYLAFAQAVQIGSTLPAGNGSVVDQTTSDGIVSIINGRLSVYFRYVPTGILESLSIEAGPDILVAQYGQTAKRD